MCRIECECGKSIAKCMLLIFNTIFMITGVVLLSVALWVRFDNNIWELLNILQVDSGDHFIEWGCYLLIAVGGLILVAGIFGCCGALMESGGFLAVYCVMLATVMILEIVCAALVITFRERAKGEVMDKLKDSYNSEYYYRDGKWSAFARTMNIAQYQFKCCGINGQSDYGDIKEHIELPGPFCTVENGNGSLLPATCFSLTSDAQKKLPDDVECRHVKLNKPITEGCEDDILEFFEDYAVIFIGLSLGFACLEIFGVIFAICLSRYRRRYKM